MTPAVWAGIKIQTSRGRRPRLQPRHLTILMHRRSAYLVLLAVLGLLVIGIIMLFSTSAFARESHGDVYAFVKRQAVWLVLGFVVSAVTALLDYHFWQRTWWLWFAL